MPRYKVIARGFHDKKLYDPEGKRKFLDTPKPFPKKKLPSWLAEMPKESTAVKNKREAQEESRQAADAEQDEQNAEDIQEASFLGEGESSVVETI